MSESPAQGSVPAAPPTVREQVAAEVVDDLVATVAPLVGNRVDELHVAAVLESRGVTDRLARVRYGHSDVFALAVAIAPRLQGAAGEEARRRARTPAWRPLVHGPIYLAPSVVISALLTVDDHNQLLIGLVTATVVAWLWGMATSVVGYQLRGQDKEAEAARAVQLMTLAGIALAVLGAASLVVGGIVGPVVLATTAVQTAFQLGACVLVFYREEKLLLLAIAPGLATGVAYVVSGMSATLVTATLAAAALSAVLTLAAAMVVCARARRLPDGPGVAVRLRLLRTVAPPVVYAGVSAVMLLFTSLHFLHSGNALALAAAPLIAGMGAVEWRAERFVESGAALLEGTGDVPGYRATLWRVLLRELATVLVTLAVLAAALVAALAAAGVASRSGTLLTAGHVLLGAVFFLGFVLARHPHFPWVLAVMVVVVAAYVMTASVAAPAGSSDPSALVAIFVVATAALVLVLLAAFVATSQDAQLFMW